MKLSKRFIVRIFCLVFCIGIGSSAMAQSMGIGGPPPSPGGVPPAPTYTGTVNLTPAPASPGTPGAAGQGDQMLRLVLSPKMVDATSLGVGLVPADSAMQSQLSIPEGVGLVVKGIVPKGAADAAGMKDNDVILKLDDQFAVDREQFEVLIRMHKPGDTVVLTLIRQAQQMKVTATLTQSRAPELNWMKMVYRDEESGNPAAFPQTDSGSGMSPGR